MRFILLFLFFIYFSIAYAEYDMNLNCRNAYTEIVNLRFKSGKSLLMQEKKLNPENDIPYYLENYIDFLKTIISEEETEYKNFKSNFRERKIKLENGNKNSPYYCYCLSEIYLQYGLAKIKFQDYLSGLLEINQAYRILVKNSEVFPDFPLNNKGIGVINVLFGTIKNNYKWSESLLPAEASIVSGKEKLIEMLDYAINDKKYNYLKSECLIIFSYVIQNFLNNPGNMSELLKYYNDSSFSNEVIQNPLLVYSQVKIHIHNYDNDKAIQLLSSYHPKNNTYPFYYIDYLTAKTKMNRLDTDSYKYLFHFVQNFKGKYYIKSAFQKLAWYYLISGDEEKYFEYIGKVRKNGLSIIEEDKQAEYEAKSGITPNPKLLKARLLFDGGYFSDAHKVIKTINSENDLLSFKDSLELIYRLARIFELTGQNDEAIKLYKKTISKGGDYSYYYAANSALKLGEIFEKMKHYSEAEIYYKKCLRLRTAEYQNSIKRSAKKGLERIATRT